MNDKLTIYAFFESSEPFGAQADARPASSTQLGSTSDVKITVTDQHKTQRTWLISKTNVCRNSAYIRRICEYATTSSITSLVIPSLSAMDGFVNFIRSSIYSVNKNASDYHIVGTHIQACILGSKLEALDYYKAALQALHKVLEPLARSSQSHAGMSPIRPIDIEQVCQHAHEIPILREMLFHAIAAHWTPAQIVYLGTLNPARRLARTAYLTSISETPLVQAWSRVWDRYTDFCKYLISTTKTPMSNRSKFFCPVEYYVNGRTVLIERRIELARCRDEAHRESGKWTKTPVLGRRQRSESDGHRKHGDKSRRRVLSPSCDGSSISTLSDLNDRMRNSGLSESNVRREGRASSLITAAKDEAPPLRTTIHNWLRVTSGVNNPERPDANTQIDEALSNLPATSHSTRRKRRPYDDGWEVLHKDERADRESEVSLDEIDTEGQRKR